MRKAERGGQGRMRMTVAILVARFFYMRSASFDHIDGVGLKLSLEFGGISLGKFSKCELDIFLCLTLFQ